MAYRRPAEVFPPGEFLREELEARGWTQTEFAGIIGRSYQTVNEIIAGKRSITPDTAKHIAAALETSPELWMGLEAAFQLWKAGDTETDNVTRRARLHNLAPVREMSRRGWIETTESIDVLEQQLRDFYETDDLEGELRFEAHAARKSTSYASVSPAENAWLYRARKLARSVSAAPFSATRFAEALNQIANLVHSAEEIRHIPRILADAGVRLVIVEGLPNSKIDGACFWIGESPVIALSLRYDRIDNFWFTLMHELGHVQNGDGQAVFVDSDLEKAQDDTDRPESERLADEFARVVLVPQEKLDSFIARIRPLYSSARIQAFAHVNHIHPGIVVGQLHHRQEIHWSNLRKLLVPIRKLITAATLTDGWESNLPVMR